MRKQCEVITFGAITVSFFQQPPPPAVRFKVGRVAVMTQNSLPPLRSNARPMTIIIAPTMTIPHTVNDVIQAVNHVVPMYVIIRYAETIHIIRAKPTQNKIFPVLLIVFYFCFRTSLLCSSLRQDGSGLLQV